MKKSGILVLASVLVVGLLAFGAFAMPFGKGNSAVKDALESGDFSSWKEAMTSELTEERFEEMRERHSEMEAKHAEMDLVISQGYDAWKEFVSDNPRGEQMLEVISEENFELLVQMHEARSSGDFELAESLAQELGLEAPEGKLGPGLHRQERGQKHGMQGGSKQGPGMQDGQGQGMHRQGMRQGAESQN
jgi:hypothetical protein